MQKKYSNGTSAGGSNAKNWKYVKSGGSSFKDASVPVNTKSRSVPSGCGH